MQNKGKAIAAVVVLGVPTVLIALTIVYFASNPLAFTGSVTALLGGGTYLLTYQEHE